MTNSAFSLEITEDHLATLQHELWTVLEGHAYPGLLALQRLLLPHPSPKIEPAEAIKDLDMISISAGSNVADSLPSTLSLPSSQPNVVSSPHHVSSIQAKYQHRILVSGIQRSRSRGASVALNQSAGHQNLFAYVRNQAKPQNSLAFIQTRTTGVLRLRGGSGRVLRPRAYAGGPVAAPVAPVAVGKKDCNRKGSRKRKRKGKKSAGVGRTNANAEGGAIGGAQENGERYYDTEGEDEAPVEEDDDPDPTSDALTSSNRLSKSQWLSDGTRSAPTTVAGKILAKLVDVANNHYQARLQEFCQNLLTMEVSKLVPQAFDDHSLSGIGDRINQLHGKKMKLDLALMLSYIELVLVIDKYVAFSSSSLKYLC